MFALLQSPAGATFAAIIKATGWQQHSVRGFLAGVVHKRLKLKLDSKLVDDKRVYYVAGEPSTKLGISQAKRAKAEIHAARKSWCRGIRPKANGD